MEATLGNLDRAIGSLRRYSVQIGHSPAGAPFLIGDTPAIPADTKNGRYGFRGGVTLTTCNQIFMPIDPHHVLFLGPAPAWIEVPPSFVHDVNHHQLMNSRTMVMYGEESGLSPWVDEWRSRHVRPEVL